MGGVPPLGYRVEDAASKKKGMWMGGVPPLGYRVQDRKLVIDGEAEIVRTVFRRYADLGSGSIAQGGTRSSGDQKQFVDERFGAAHRVANHSRAVRFT